MAVAVRQIERKFRPDGSRHWRVQITTLSRMLAKRVLGISRRC
jgi:hypothetical protein